MADKNIKVIHQVQLYNDIITRGSTNITWRMTNVLFFKHIFLHIKKKLLFLQFLLDHNFESTAKTLIQEVTKMGFQNSACKLETIADPYTQLILCYNIGDHSTFFQVKSYVVFIQQN